MNTFTLNGNTYIAKRFDFNLICDLDDFGINMQDIGKKPMATLRAYIALSANVSIDMAGEMMQEHMINGGNFDDVSKVMSKEMQDSDFFRHLSNQKQAVSKKGSKAQSNSSTKAIEN